MNAIKKYKQTRDILFNKQGFHPLSKMVITNGPVKNVHYLEAGKGPPLILIHGGGSNSIEWLNIMEPLAAHFHLYVVDRPGCGLTDHLSYRGIDLRKSAVDFISSFMDALGLEKTKLVGHSMGGYFSICFALSQPHRVQQLLLAGAPAGMNRKIPLLLRLMGTKGLNWLLTHTIAKPSVQNVKNIYRQLLITDLSKLPDAYCKHFYYCQLLPGTITSFTTLLENALTFSGWNKKYYIGDKMDHLQIPVRFIWGDKDSFEEPATGRQKTRQINDHRFEVIPGAGHCVWLDQPEQFVAFAVDMLQDEQPKVNAAVNDLNKEILL